VNPGCEAASGPVRPGACGRPPDGDADHRKKPMPADIATPHMVPDGVEFREADPADPGPLAPSG
jgi:hypothetical protein